MPPRVASWEDVAYVSEQFDSDTGALRYTIFAVVDDHDVIHIVKLDVRKQDISFDQLMTALKPIPDGIVYPDWQPHSAQLTEVPVTISANVHIKRPDVALYDIFAEYNVLYLLPQGLLQEAQTMEFLQKHPHPNIIVYHGCRAQRGHIVDIVLEKHGQDLIEHLKHRPGSIDKSAFMAALRSAVKHLHSLDWAHNDLHPANVMVDEAGMPVLIDFGSAQKIGELLGTSRGTKGWMEGEMKDYMTSKAEHDVFGLEKIEAWLDDPVPYGRRK